MKIEYHLSVTLLLHLFLHSFIVIAFLVINLVHSAVFTPSAIMGNVGTEWEELDQVGSQWEMGAGWQEYTTPLLGLFQTFCMTMGTPFA